MNEKTYKLIKVMFQVISFIIYLVAIVGISNSFMKEHNWVSIIALILLYLGYKYIASDKRTIKGLLFFTFVTIVVKLLLTVAPIIAYSSINTNLQGISTNSDSHLKYTQSKNIENNKGLYSLEVTTIPTNTKVQIMNIKPKYYNGIRLKKGRYNIKVSKPGYITGDYYIDVSQNTVTAPIVLKKKHAKSYNSKNYQIYAKGNKVIYKIIDRTPCYITYSRNREFLGNTCSYHLNSRGEKIYCTKNKKVCKTADEITGALGV